MNKGKNRAAAAVELAAVLLATAAAFAWGQRAALIERGYAARGGEYMLLLIPAIYYAGKQVLRDWIAELRSVWRSGKPQERKLKEWHSIGPVPGAGITWTTASGASAWTAARKPRRRPEPRRPSGPGAM